MKIQSKVNSLSLITQEEITKRYHSAISPKELRREIKDELGLTYRELCEVIRKFPHLSRRSTRFQRYKEKTQKAEESVKNGILKAIEHGCYTIPMIQGYINITRSAITRIANVNKINLSFIHLFYPHLTAELEREFNMREIAIKYQVKLDDINKIVNAKGIVLKGGQRHRMHGGDNSYIESIGESLLKYLKDNQDLTISKKEDCNIIQIKFGLTLAELKSFIDNMNLSSKSAKSSNMQVKTKYENFPTRYIVKSGVFYHSENAGNVGERFNPNDYLVL